MEQEYAGTHAHAGDRTQQLQKQEDTCAIIKKNTTSYQTESENEWMNEQMNGWMNEWTNEMNKLSYECLVEWNGMTWHDMTRHEMSWN